jgi:hypothetical protein
MKSTGVLNKEGVSRETSMNPSAFHCGRGFSLTAGGECGEK